MPLARSPPPPPEEVPTNPRRLSDQSLTPEFDVDYENNPDTPFRIRRRRTEDVLSAEMQSFMSEMRSLLNDFKTEQDIKFNKMYAKMEEVLTQNCELKTSVDFLSTTCDTLKTQINDLQSERKNCLQQLQSMEDKLETYERQTRSTCVEIRNIPRANTETKDSLINIATSIGQKINVSLQSQDIRDIFRINSKEKSRKTIIVDFTSVILREKFIKMYKLYTKKQRLDTEFLKIDTTPTPIFISENLTSKMKKIFFMARDFAKTNDYRYCWISNGKVYLRKREGERYTRINNENDLMKLKTVSA